MHSAPSAGICRIIEEVLSPVNSRSVLAYALECKVLGDEIPLSWLQVDETFLQKIEMGLRLFGVAPMRRKPLLDKLRSSARSANSAPPQREVLTVAIEHEGDILTARNGVRQLAQSIGFSHTDQIRVATIVSELARNIQLYCGRGEIVSQPLGGGKCGIEILARDQGKGISNIEYVLSGDYRSRNHRGIGLLGCKRLADEFEVDTGPRGTQVRVLMYL